MSAIGRAGLFAGAPLRVLKFKGDQRLGLLDIPAGHLKGKGEIALSQGGQNRYSNGPGDLSETAGAEAQTEA